MAILDKNLMINKEFKSLYDIHKDDLYPLEETKNKQFTYMINGLYIHSKYNPQREAQRMIDLIVSDGLDDTDMFIILGNGLGFVAQLLFEWVNNQNLKTKPSIIIIEKDTQSFATSLNHTDYTDLLNAPHVKLLLDAEKELIGSIIQSLPTKKIKFLIHRPLFMHNQNYYREVQNYINYILNRKDMNHATVTRFQKLWARNSLYNANVINKTQDLGAIINAYQDHIAVVVAGGPSLTSMIPLLSQYQEKLIIIAVDTTVKYLLSHDIKPDFVVIVDPQYWNYCYIDGINLKKIPIITDATSYYQIFRKFDNNYIIVPKSIFALTNYFATRKSRGVLAAGGSVSTTAFDIARQMGVSQIILAGVDLGFPNKNTHFKGAFFENNFIAQSDYFNTVENKSFAYLSHAGFTRVQGTQDEIISDPKMNLFQKWFEREIPLTSAKVYLPNLGGSLIKGTEVVELEKLASIMSNSPIKKTWTPHNLYEDASFSDKLSNFHTQLLKVRELTKKIIGLITKEGKINASKEKLFQKTSEELISNLELKIVLDILTASAQDILLAIKENVSYADDEEKSLWIKIRSLYSAAYEASFFYEKLIQKMFKFL